MSRADATRAIEAGRVEVDGRLITDPARRVVPERARIVVDRRAASRSPWRTILFHKPRGIVTTRRDREGRRTVHDVLGAGARALIAVGRLDLASTGLLLLTTDTQLANWIADPANAVPRLYVVTVRGRVVQEAADRLTRGVDSGRGRLAAHAVRLRKSSARESHLVVELREGRNREVRRLFAAIGHEVTALKRVQLGGLALKSVGPGEWRELSREEIARAFPGAPIGRHNG